MEKNRPRSREKNVTGSGSVHKRGSGLGTGPVGSGGRPARKTSSTSFHQQQTYQSGGYSSRPTRNSGSRSPLSILLIVAVLLFGGGGLSGLFSDSDSSTTVTTTQPSSTQSTTNYFGSSIFSSNASSSGWVSGKNTGVLNTSVASNARDKRTVIYGDGSDQVTIMVYMCGTDLESKSAMATYDLQEMIASKNGENVNVIVYTGGTKQWNNNVVSNQTNQIYQIKNGNITVLESNMGNKSMTLPDTLTSFIQYADTNFPANRKELIFWDHGGGSVSGYGYDEKYPSSGSMDLSEIDTALKNAGVSFDFIGFDACLMATVETALTLDDYADYLIASEETEPGVGWYYTNWLSALSNNPSMSTLELGKNIVDDFVKTCNEKTPGQKTTLSVIDLAEVSSTVPTLLSDFSKATYELIQNDSYAEVSKARYNTREFSQQSKIDQVDLVHLAKNMNTEEGDALADALLNAVKYNQTSSNMSNAYGISIYFPARKISKVDQAVDTYKEIGMDEEYTRCIQAFASMEVSGQSTSGGTYSPLSSLLGEGISYSGDASTEMITQLIGALLTGGSSGIEGLSSSNMSFFTGRSLDTDQMASYISNHQFNASDLVWTKASSGAVINLSEEQWDLVQDVELNVYYDDGYGYIDLGYDNVFEFDDDGNLMGTYDNTWLAINQQPVAYYYQSTVDDGDSYAISGYIPALLNGERVNLIVEFTDEDPYGVIVGANYDYQNEIDVVAKNITQLEVGDTLDFLCDYYSYSGTYQDSYYLGEQMIVTSDMQISNVEIGDSVSAMYRFTDIYGQSYWTEVIPES